jgi:hypothetical protein
MEGNHMDTFDKQTSTARDRRPWDAPTVKAVGNFGEVLRNGKHSMSAGDPGERTKNPQQG